MGVRNIEALVLAVIAFEPLACGGSIANESSTDASPESSADAAPDTTSPLGQPDGGDASLEVGGDATAPVDAPTTVDATNPPNDATYDVDAGTCFNGRCLITLATGQNAPFAIVADGVNAYWTNSANGTAGAGSVMRVPVAGGTTPVALTSGVTQPKYIVSDDARVYWTEGTTVNAWDKASGTLLTLASGQSYPTGVAVDPAYVYWTNGSPTGSLFRMALDGGVPTLIASNGGNAEQLVISPTRAYWNSFANVISAPLDGDGGAATVFFYDSNYSVRGLGIDSNNLYYTEESFGGPVGRLPLDGGAVTVLSTNNGTEGVVSDGTYVYFTSANGDPPAYDGAVLRVPVAGGTVVTIATGNWPDSIAIDATSVYWASSRSGLVMRATPR
jgi:hypothetical protein